METTFTPLASLFGGVLIGTAAVLLMAMVGRIMGATGIWSGLIAPSSRSDFEWRLVLLAGMVSGPFLVSMFTGHMPRVDVPMPLGVMLAGGFLVGVGVTFGGGCTSGHGVCGLARFSQRSLVATVTFMLAAFATVFVTRHVIGA